MKISIKNTSGFIQTLILAAGVLSFNGMAMAALNEKRVEKQASGRYKGRTMNGVEILTMNGVPFESHPLPDMTGKVKVPIGKKKPKSSLRNDSLPGNDKARFKGKEKKSTVSRNGRKVRLKDKGEMSMDDGFAPLKGNLNASITKRGGKFVAKGKMTGKREFGGGHGETIKGDVKGKN